MTENITRIGQNIFEGCKKLSTVTFPKTITSIPAGMFKNCTALSSFKYPEKFNTIFNSAFYGCTSLTEINDPAHYIYFNAFENCTGLKKATVSDAAKQMFKGCTALESVSIFDNEISESMFEGCTNLKSVSLLGSRTSPTSVKTIGSRAFFGCESLTSAPLSGVSIINSNAFANCKNLTTVSLPTSITTVNTNAFDFTTVTKLVINPVLGNKSTPNNNAYQFLPSSAAGLTIYAHRIDQTFIERYWKGEVKYFEDTDITSSSSLFCGIDFALNTSSENISLPISSISYGKHGEASRNLNINSDNKYSIRDLQPEETYYIYLTDKNGQHTYAFKTPTPTVTFKNSTNRTQTSLGGTVTASSDESVKPICYLLDKECTNGQPTIITGLIPGNQYTLRGRADYNGKSFFSSNSYSTATDGMNPKIIVKATPTRLIFEGTYTKGSATVTNFGFISDMYSNDFDKEYTKVIKGLEPGDTKWAHFGVKVAENTKAYKVSLSGTTVNVTWSEGDFVATSTKSVRLRVATNCDAETGTGIEWRRNDAPDNVKSTYVACPVVDGILVGSLRNLNPEVYYKFRPVYETSTGKKYYGEWAGFYSGDASVYFDPEVRTLEDIEVFENSALVACYIMPGSDDVKRQGIQYWHKGSPKGRADAPLEITTSGIKSTVTLPDLQPGTEYAYRAFAVTETGTVYGEEKSFITKGTSGIDYIIDNQENNLTVTLMENPTVTPIRFAVSGTSAESIEVSVASMSGAIITRRHIPLDAEILSLDINVPHGVYLLSVNDGMHQSTSRVIIR
ncbi:MAG: leucine-rich repeat protein [Bacteroides sp.]|nr:leucine-rich repeat protein [Bacteroides sp.]MCM1390525.1 leucine-rich repeat protein [Bacteroides sp.]